MWTNFALLLGLLAIIWLLHRPKWPVRIVIDHNRVCSHHGLPRSNEQSILRFFEEDVSFSGRVTICARRHSNGYLKLQIAGPVDSGTRQRIRNVLIQLL